MRILDSWGRSWLAIAVVATACNSPKQPPDTAKNAKDPQTEPARGQYWWGDHGCNYPQFKMDACSQYTAGARQYSARLCGVPWGVPWEDACAATGAVVQGVRFSRPSRCKNVLSAEMWGEFDVPDVNCNGGQPQPPAPSPSPQPPSGPPASPSPPAAKYDLPQCVINQATMFGNDWFYNGQQYPGLQVKVGLIRQANNQPTNCKVPEINMNTALQMDVRAEVNGVAAAGRWIVDGVMQGTSSNYVVPFKTSFEQQERTFQFVPNDPRGRFKLRVYLRIGGSFGQSYFKVGKGTYATTPEGALVFEGAPSQFAKVP